MRIYSLDGTERPKWYDVGPEQRGKRLETTQEITPIRAEPSDDNDRGTVMLVMVLGWLVYFIAGVIVGKWLL